MGILLDRHVQQLAAAAAAGDWQRLSALQARHPATARALEPLLACGERQRACQNAGAIDQLRALEEQGNALDASFALGRTLDDLDRFAKDANAGAGNLTLATDPLVTTINTFENAVAAAAQGIDHSQSQTGDLQAQLQLMRSALAAISPARIGSRVRPRSPASTRVRAVRPSTNCRSRTTSSRVDVKTA